MKRVLGVLLVMGALGLESRAQPLQPVYLQYDGFVRNRDARTITLSFGYYNMKRSWIRSTSSTHRANAASWRGSI